LDDVAVNSNKYAEKIYVTVTSGNKNSECPFL